MSHSRTSRNEDNQTIEESKDQNELLKKALHTAIKRQTELEKKVRFYSDERAKLLEHIKNVDLKNVQLTTYSEQLDTSLIEAHKKNKDLTDAFQQLKSDFAKANEKIESLTIALQQSQQTTASTVENKATSTSADHAVSAVTEPATRKEPTAETAATSGAGASSYSMFSPWRILGYSDTKATPENPAHTSLADLTKASIEQALAENNTSPGMRK